MESQLQDARTLTHGTYADVIIAEYRTRPTAASDAPYVVLELQDGTRVIDRATRFVVDGESGGPPAVGQTYCVVVSAIGESPDAGDLTLAGSLRYETARALR
jgi:hypothetical protein